MSDLYCIMSLTYTAASMENVLVETEADEVMWCGCCSKLDEDTQLALALSESASDTRENAITQPATLCPAKDVFSVLLHSAQSPVRPKNKKKAW